MEGTVTLVLAGGEGSRLRPLTDLRPKPLVPFAGRPLVDFTLRNCLRSGLTRVFVLVQHGRHAMREHLARNWGGTPAIEALGPEEAGRPFLGTADAVRAVFPLLPPARRLLVLAGDHVYRMDYRRLMRRHVGAEAAATISVVPTPLQRAAGLGLVTCDRRGFVASFREKPADLPLHPVASMGIYVFERALLEDYLATDILALDFGRHLLPAMVARGERVAAHAFRGYWRDIADIAAYHAAVMDIARGAFDPGPGWPGAGCSFVNSTFLGRDVRLGADVELSECVVLDGARVGEHVKLRRVVVEEGACVPDGADLDGAGGVRIAAEALSV